MKRRAFLDLSARLGTSVVLAFILFGTALAHAAAGSALIDDPEAPAAGNPQGDITIVTYFDYNCPFCKKAEPALDKLIKTDGGIRLIYKDWPILTKASLYGARMALAAKYQGKYDAVHKALMDIPGMRISEDRMLEAIKTSGVDMTRLEADLAAHEKDISNLLNRNQIQAETIGLQGTPAFLVGRYLVRAALDYDGFSRAVAEARQHAKSQ